MSSRKHKERSAPNICPRCKEPLSGIVTMGDKGRMRHADCADAANRQRERQQR